MKKIFLILVCSFMFLNLTGCGNKYKGQGEYSTPKSESYILSKNNRMEESIFLGLRMIKGIDIQKFKDEFGCDINSIYGSAIKKYVGMGYMELSCGILKLTEKGIDVSNSIFAEFIID